MPSDFSCSCLNFKFAKPLVYQSGSNSNAPCLNISALYHGKCCFSCSGFVLDPSPGLPSYSLDLDLRKYPNAPVAVLTHGEAMRKPSWSSSKPQTPVVVGIAIWFAWNPEVGRTKRHQWSWHRNTSCGNCFEKACSMERNHTRTIFYMTNPLRCSTNPLARCEKKSLITPGFSYLTFPLLQIKALPDWCQMYCIAIRRWAAIDLTHILWR